MASVNLAVIYYSSTGTLQAMAERVAKAGEKAGAEVRLRQVAETAPPEAIAVNPAWGRHLDATRNEPKATGDDVAWADAVLFGSPARYGNVSAQLKQFLDSLGPLWGQGLLADKAYAGVASSMTKRGGQESSLLALYNTIYHFGGIIVPPGYTDPVKLVDGNPYGVSHVSGPTNDAPLTDDELAALDHLAERIVTIAGKLLSQ